MQKAVAGTVQRAGEAVAGGAMATNKKVQNMKPETFDPSESDRITSDFGVLQHNTDVWLKASTGDKQGPALLEDNFAREKIMRFDHERIPERVVHARGSGAFGTFKLYESAEDVTSAGVLTDTSRTTPVFVRFSTVLGSRGSSDTVRDVRGFAVKLYTEEGNWDIVGNDIPVFFIQDAIKFPDVIHAGKPEPQTEIPQAQSAHNNFWDFQYMHKEATHMFMWAMSDRGIPRSFRMMQGFGVNTFTLINKEGVRSFVKFHWTPTIGVHSLVWDEALKISGQDPDYHRRDLYTAIENGVYPTWKFGIQICPESRADEFDFDILDATKIWPEEVFPVRYIGEMELNRNVDEFFPQIEQVAFCTAHIVPGIGFSDDPLLQGRNFSYFDTQISRLGVNFQELPVNRPVCPVMNHHRDGALRHRITKGQFNYWPNRGSVVPPGTISEGAYVDYPQKVVAMKQRLNSVKFSEHVNQAQLFWNSMAPHEKLHIIKALSFELSKCEDPIVYERLVERLAEISLELAQAVSDKVGAPKPEQESRPNHGKKSAALSQGHFAPEALGYQPTIASRMVAIIVGDGFNFAEYEAVKGALSAANAFCFTIGPRKSEIKSSGKSVKPDHHFESMRSTLFDSIYIPGGEHITTLIKQGRVLHWIREAFGHCKTIGASGDGVKIVKAAIGIEGMRFSESGDGEVVDCYGVVTSAGGKISVGNALKMAKGAKSFLDAYAYNISLHRNYQRELDGLTELVAY
ncbi:Catalase [Venustampulla echinocandica]|uniref:Catalase n=1 Tax=Venustampulla echinocandica TaxID=2656787 RepID=A0A370TW39_9HELO|nr:Catalase [Venustampulla echinocandica]RDL39746.1 Catalase [Venustampulla echinocandica]